MDVIRIDQWREWAKHALNEDDAGLIVAIVIALGVGVVFTAWLASAVIF